MSSCAVGLTQQRVLRRELAQRFFSNLRYTFFCFPPTHPSQSFVGVAKLSHGHNYGNPALRQAVLAQEEAPKSKRTVSGNSSKEKGDKSRRLWVARLLDAEKARSPKLQFIVSSKPQLF